jgi:hypothetical protein
MSSSRPLPIPLRPDHRAIEREAMQSLTRACLAVARGVLDRSELAGDYAKRQWRDDRGVELILRAASGPALTSGATWAGPLAQVAYAFLSSLVPFSAGADLLRRGLQLQFDGAGKILVPGLVFAPGGADFVRQAAPIPVIVGTSSTQCTLEPFAFKAITELTGEMVRSSNAEALTRQALVDSCGPQLDAVLFSNAAGVTDERPPGLLNGIAPLTPAAAGPGALVADLVALVTTIAPVAGNGGAAIIAAPSQAVAIALGLAQPLPYGLLTSSSLPAKTVIAIAVNAVCSAMAPSPTIDASQQAAIVEADPAGPLVDIGGIVAAPIRSMFQTDAAALRLRWPMSWALRSPQGVAYMTAVNW